MDAKINLKRIGQIKILAIIVVLLILVLSYFYYKNEEETLVSHIQNDLQSIAAIKIEQIRDWFEDERADAHSISMNYFLKNSLSEYFRDSNLKNKSLLNRILNEIKVEHSYSNVSIISSDRKLFWSSDSSFNLDFRQIDQQIKEAVKENKVYVSNLYKINEGIEISFISPIDIESEKLKYLIILTLSGDSFLYPLLSKWPSEFRSNETILIGKENNKIVFLNKLKYLNNSALELRISINRNELIEVMAAQGSKGIVHGLDYRGENVFAYVSNIPGTKWFLVTKVDESEIFEGLVSEVITITVLTLLFIAITVIGMFSLYNSRQRNIYKELYNKELALWKSEEKFKITLDSLGSGVITTDINGKVNYLNSMAEKLTGWEMREALGRDLDEIYSVKNEYTGEPEKNIINKVFKEGIVKELANHTLLMSKEGNEIPVMDTGAPLFDDEGNVEGIVLVFQDETEKRKNERLLVESERRLRSTMDGMLEGCQIINPDWRYLYVNSTAARHGRKRKEELLGKTMLEAYPGIENTELFAILRYCFETYNSHAMENKFIYPDGSEGWFELNIEPVEEGLFILSIDITQRKLSQKALLESEEKYRELVENIDNVIFSMNTEGTIQFINKAISSILEYQPEEIIGHNFREFFEGQLLDNAEIIHYEFFKGNSAPRDMQIKTKSGELKWVKLLRSPVYLDGEIIGVRGVFTDITERINSMKALERAKQAAEEFYRIKTQFFANMSHELRTPFVGIMGYAEMLLESLSGAEEKEMVQGILNTSKRMKDTLTKILDISRLEFYPNEVKFKSIETNTILYDIYFQMKPIAENKKLELVFNYGADQIEFTTDENLFSEIMKNLISNAIIYTPKGKVMLSVAEKMIDQHRYVIFKVADTGIGIADEDMEVIWEEFRQASEGSTRTYQGTGLGLSIVKKYTEFLGGTITLESEVGKGSVFTLELPADQKNII